jgi:GTP-binding protein
MKILTAEFLTSATQPSQFPAGDVPEIAFAGRSNVGKSSLLNAVLGRKGLARVSQTPGRTRLLNFFRVTTTRGPQGQTEFRFVDLPGYGYAKVSKAVHEQWGPMIEGYIQGRRSLRGIVVLTDIRRGEEEERQLIRWATALGTGVLVVATKVDKLSRGNRLEALRKLEAFFGMPVLGCSATTGESKDALWTAILALLASPRANKRVTTSMSPSSDSLVPQASRFSHLPDEDGTS